MRKAWWYAALLLLVVLGLAFLGERAGWWSALIVRAPARGEGSEALLAEPAVTDPELRGARTPTSPPGASGAMSSALPLPVDFDAVDRATDLHGTVVESDGTPVAGGVIQAVSFPWRRTSVLASGTFDERVEGKTTRSAADGTFTLRLRSGTVVGLEVKAPGFAPIRLLNRQAGERVRVVLAPAVALVVRAVDPEGNPLPGVDLELRRYGHDGKNAFAYEGRTGNDGTHRFPDLPRGGTAGLKARQGSEGGWASDWAVPLPEAGEGHHEIVITGGRLVRGRVTDAASGRAVEGARIGMGWTFFRETRTDADGRYAMGGWTGDGYRELHARAPGYAPVQAAVGDASEVDFVLDRGFAVEGRVLGERATAIAQAAVAVVGSTRVGGMQRVSASSGRSDASGRFRLADLRRDLPHVLIVMAEGHGRLLVAFDPPPGAEAVVDLGDVVVPGGQLVAGQVLDDAGHGLADVEVTLSGANDDVNRLRPEGAPPIDRYYGRTEERRSDDLGRFAFADLAPGTYLLTAVYGGGSEVTEEVRLPAGVDVTDVRLSFRPLQHFRVRVLDAKGRPVPAALVNLEAWGGDDLFEPTGDDGTAHFHLPLDVVQVRVHVLDANERPVLVPEPRVVPVAEAEVELVLAVAALVRGRLLAPDDTPIVRGLVNARRGGELLDRATTEGDGGFVLRVPPGDAVDVTFEGDVYVSTDEGGAERRRRPWTVSRPAVPVDGAPLVLRAEAVDALEELVVRVVASDGSPVAGATVQLQPLPETGPGTQTVGANGTARFQGLPARAWSILVLPPEGRALALALATRSGVMPGAGPLTIRLEVPILLEGTVVDPEGARIAGAQVQTGRHFGDEPIRVRSDADGRFVLPIPPDLGMPMILRVYASHGESTMLFAELTGVDAHAGPVRVVLRPHRGW